MRCCSVNLRLICCISDRFFFRVSTSTQFDNKKRRLRLYILLIASYKQRADNKPDFHWFILQFEAIRLMIFPDRLREFFFLVFRLVSKLLNHQALHFIERATNYFSAIQCKKKRFGCSAKSLIDVGMFWDGCQKNRKIQQTRKLV